MLGLASSIPERVHRGARHTLYGPPPSGVDGSHAAPLGIVEKHGHAVGGKHGDGQPRLVAHERITLPA